ncbi:hypothetical protein HYH03_016278 [Edaphochlamys debaryana]|uniref:Uncharacterized protein n=1 Tax=Edaphochlamys debaryana TaxID=47281 RepID=A0A835XS19_9CHLO|nr:hypothetical protein HYH03_016278 [Edaphochlamys debaryana]|eukprot:KAG2484984.1 hypothetical protein HYH03_016278 [Edaphochlamys debaryana]
MGKRTGYRTEREPLTIGDPEVGTKTWNTEYDVEFTESFQREQAAAERAEAASRRTDLRTPRSLKKGFVTNEDYVKLDDRYGQALSSYRDLQLELGALQHRLSALSGSEAMFVQARGGRGGRRGGLGARGGVEARGEEGAALSGSEAMFVQAVEEQNDLVSGLQRQLRDLGESVGRLLGGVERNRALVAVMNAVQDAPTEQVVTGAKLMHDSDTSRRLASLESKLEGVAEALHTMSRTQAALARAAAAGGGLGGRRGSAGGGEEGLARRRRHEKIEKMPTPTQLGTQNSFWKP